MAHEDVTKLPKPGTVIAAAPGGLDVTVEEIRGLPTSQVQNRALNIIEAQPKFTPTSSREVDIMASNLVKRSEARPEGFPRVTMNEAIISLLEEEAAREEVFFRNTGVDPRDPANRTLPADMLRDLSTKRAAGFRQRAAARTQGSITITPSRSRQ